MPARADEVTGDSRRTDGERSRHARPVNQGAVVASLAFTGLVVAFMMTLMTPLVPELPSILGASPEACLSSRPRCTRAGRSTTERRPCPAWSQLSVHDLPQR